MRTRKFRIIHWAFAGVGAAVVGVVATHFLDQSFASAETRSSRTPPEIVLAAPGDRSVVVWRELVSGTVSGEDADVWVIVHPLANSDYWVQPRVTVGNDGTWRTQTYFGREYGDSGVLFELLAVTNPTSVLKEGDVLSDWPSAEAYSNPVLVRRR